MLSKYKWFRRLRGKAFVPTHKGWLTEKQCIKRCNNDQSLILANGDIEDYRKLTILQRMGFK